MAVAEQVIHVVEDDVSVCRALGIMLTGYGYSVRTYFTANHYFRDVPRNASGCLVLDIHLPGLDGWKALQRVIRSGANRPVIVITADKNGGLRERVLQAGAAGFLQKPFSAEELVCLIRLACEPKHKIVL